jgi:hypothetical protein
MSESSWVSQETLDEWGVTEVEFAIIIAALIFVGVIIITITCLYCCFRKAKATEAAPAHLEPVRELPEPAPPQPAEVKVEIDGTDKLIAINGRPLNAQRRGMALPYAPDLSVVLAPSQPNIGAARQPLPGAEDGGAGFGAGAGKIEYDQQGTRARVQDDSSWEADRILDLEARVRSLEANLHAARSGALPPIDARGRALAATIGTPSPVAATPADIAQMRSDGGMRIQSRPAGVSSRSALGLGGADGGMMFNVN